VIAQQLIDRRGRCRLVYEPIADLARGTICGYEALERFPDAITPEAWRVEALRRGLEPDFDAFVVASVLHARESLPDGCFLAFNVRPATLLREAVRRVLTRTPQLERLVIELVPRVARRDEARLVACVEELRAAGARFAVDHVGGEDGVLRHAALVRPELAKLEDTLVADLDGTPAKRALLFEIERLAGRFGTLLIAKGVTRAEELDALMRLRVPLAQGPLIGVRAKTLTPVAFALSRYVRERGAAMLEPGSLASLVERTPAPARRPPAPASETFRVTDGLAAAAQRALLRPPERRFDPLVCRDANGDHAGVVPFERLVEALAHAADRSSTA
jgi:EAL domain-containing protein (putative c-di-GMP-specific phosphodiesterase class I)